MSVFRECRCRYVFLRNHEDVLQAWHGRLHLQAVSNPVVVRISEGEVIIIAVISSADGISPMCASDRRDNGFRAIAAVPGGSRFRCRRSLLRVRANSKISHNLLGPLDTAHRDRQRTSEAAENGNLASRHDVSLATVARWPKGQSERNQVFHRAEHELQIAQAGTASRGDAVQALPNGCDNDDAGMTARWLATLEACSCILKDRPAKGLCIHSSSRFATRRSALFTAETLASASVVGA